MSVYLAEGCASRARILRGGPGDDIGSLIGQISEKNALLRLLFLPHSISPLLSLSLSLSFPSSRSSPLVYISTSFVKETPGGLLGSLPRFQEGQPDNYRTLDQRVVSISLGREFLNSYTNLKFRKASERSNKERIDEVS